MFAFVVGVGIAFAVVDARPQLPRWSMVLAASTMLLIWLRPRSRT